MSWGRASIFKKKIKRKFSLSFSSFFRQHARALTAHLNNDVPDGLQMRPSSSRDIPCSSLKYVMCSTLLGLPSVSSRVNARFFANERQLVLTEHIISDQPCTQRIRPLKTLRAPNVSQFSPVEDVIRGFGF